uniref:carbohydrate binding domain-containing protein n=1 Tax=Moraxella canis TaxID=90239 RepID=UPI000667BCA2
AKFDSLEVGGRNLVIKSGDLGAWSNFVRSSMSQTDSTQYKTPVLRVLCTDDSWYAQKSAQSTHHIKQGESYVLSFFVKSNSSLNNTFVYGDNNIRQRLITSSTVLDETWQYIKVAFVASQDTQNIGVIIGGHGIANQSYVEFAEVKLERGTIATDWTPAPEDLQADIDSKASLASLDEFKQAQADKDGATAERINALNAELNSPNVGVKAKIATAEKAIVDNNKAITQRVNQLDADYKNANGQMLGRITNVEKVASDATQAIAQTHQQLTAKFDSLEVGGRNLVIKSGDLGAWSNFVRSSMSQTDSTQYKTPVLRVLCTDDSWYAQKSAQSTHHIKQGESYVLSFFVKSNSSLNNTFVYGDNNIRQRLITSSTVLDETWQYIKVAFVASQDTQNIGVIIGGHGIANQSYVEFAEVKLERGTIATDWTPAPEDLQADIDSKASLASLDEFKQAQADKDGATA